MAALYVFIGGGLGSLCRYGIAVGMSQFESKLPAATLIANILACLVLGCIAGIALKNTQNTTLLLLGGVGFCGGFSTFSTFSLENFQLWESGQYNALIFNILLSVVLCFASVIIGLRISTLFQ